jgi:hypothetical protein
MLSTFHILFKYPDHSFNNGSIGQFSGAILFLIFCNSETLLVQSESINGIFFCINHVALSLFLWSESDQTLLATVFILFILCHPNIGIFPGAEVIIFQTCAQNECRGSVIAFVISEVLIAAITDHHNITIPNTFNIKLQIIHNHVPQTSFKKFVVLSSFDTCHKIVSLNCHTVTQSSLILRLSAHKIPLCVPHHIQFHTTYINSNPKLKANIVYTGTIANAINSLILNFAKNQSFFLSKKYISQNTGEIIIYIHIYIHLIISTNHNAIIKIEYISTNNRSKTILTTRSHIVLTEFKSNASISSTVSRDNIP